MKRSSVRLSVCPSVCPIIRPQQRRAAGLLLSAMWAGDIDRQRQPGAQQQRRRSWARSSKREQCHAELSMGPFRVTQPNPTQYS